MTVQPPRDTYKALLWDYDFLLAQSDEECCYSLSDREVQILLAIVDYIAWKTRYKPTETTIDEQLILRWQGNLARKLMSGCCPDDDLIYRVNEDGVVQSSDNGGETWEDAPQADPRNHVTLTPVTVTGTVNEKRCKLANSGVGALQMMVAEMVAKKEAGAGFAAIIDTIIAILLTFGVLAGGLGVLVALVMAVGTLIFTAAALVFEAAFTAEVWQDLLCLIYCNIKSDGTFKPAGFEAIKSGIVAAHPGIAGDTLKGFINGMGENGLMNATRAGFDAGLDCDECDCPVGCIDESWIVAGTLIAQDDFSITIQAAPSAIFGGATVVSYGSLNTADPLFCCFLCEAEVISGSMLTTGWVTCAGEFVGTGQGVNSDIRRTDAVQDGAPLIIKFTFNVDDNCL